MQDRRSDSFSTGVIVRSGIFDVLTNSGIYKFILSMLRALSALIGGAEDVLEPLVNRYVPSLEHLLIQASISNIAFWLISTTNVQICAI